jgi:flagellar biosynthesis chaperone FliJ
MEGFNFRLQTLLDQKLDMEAKAKLAVAEKQRVLHEQQRILLRLKENEKRVERSIFCAREDLLVVSVANAAVDVQRRNDYLLALEQDLGIARQQTLIQKFAVEEAEMNLNEAQAHALECFREAEKLSRYRDKLEKRFLAEAAKKEEREQDEIGTTMHASRRAGL